MEKLWDGFLEHIGVLLAALSFSGVFFAINRLSQFQTWVRTIPTDYVLTPFVVLLVVLFVVIKINLKQRKKLGELQIASSKPEGKPVLVTHYGVWWKIYFDSEYVEDFPYCSCCDPRQKLVQKEWHPDEVYFCPKTKTEYRLFDNIPWNKEKILEHLYSGYFSGHAVERMLFDAYQRIKELHPELEEQELLRRVLSEKPFNKIPEEKREELLSRFQKHHELFHYIERNHKAYRPFLDLKPKQANTRHVGQIKTELPSTISRGV